MTFWDWIETTKPEGVLTAIVAVVIGFATWRISWVQKEIAKEKVISDLFDKRYKVYECHIRAIIKITQGPGVDPAEGKSLSDDMIYFGEQARFLFDEKIHNHLERVRTSVFEYKSWSNHLKTDVPMRTDGEGEYRMEIWQKKVALETDLNEELAKTLPRLLMPYLRINDFRTAAKP